MDRYTFQYFLDKKECTAGFVSSGAFSFTSKNDPVAEQNAVHDVLFDGFPIGYHMKCNRGKSHIVVHHINDQSYADEADAGDN